MDCDIGKKIYYLRKAKKITQNQLAQFLYVTPQTISKWESGNGTPDISLIPKIAIFFDISLDYLFNTADVQRVKTLALKYSVLKDDYSYSQAMSMIDSVLEDETISNAEKGEYLSLKGHIFLQKSRDSIKKAIEVTKEAMDYTDKQEERIPLELQIILLRTMNGEFREVRNESKGLFESNPKADTLYIYLETLTILCDYEEICNVIDSSDVRKIIDIKKDTMHIWIQYFRALAELNKENEARELYEMLIPLASQQDKFTITFTYLKMLSELKREEELAEIKGEALRLVDTIDYDEYVKKVIITQIETL